LVFSHLRMFVDISSSESAMRNKVRVMPCVWVIVVYIFKLYIKPLTHKFPNDLLRSSTFILNYIGPDMAMRCLFSSTRLDIARNTIGGKEISMMRNAIKYIATRKYEK
jgi:hypothetical protein